MFRFHCRTASHKSANNRGSLPSMVLRSSLPITWQVIRCPEIQVQVEGVSWVLVTWVSGQCQHCLNEICFQELQCVAPEGVKGVLGHTCDPPVPRSPLIVTSKKVFRHSLADITLRNFLRVSQVQTCGLSWGCVDLDFWQFIPGIACMAGGL